MKHISILVPENARLGSVEGPRQLFCEVNNLLKAQHSEPLFDVQLIGLKDQVSMHGGICTIHTDAVLQDVCRTDLIIIPAVDGDIKLALHQNEEMLPWIKYHYSLGAEVASLCVGAFLLASTGLLDGRKCSTHWLFANQFRSMFPDVELVDDKIITHEQRLYSSGGAYSFLNLLLYLIEKYAGREMAILSSKVFAIEIDRESQSPFAIFQGQKEHEDDDIRAAQQFIEDHFDQRIMVDELAARLALGRRAMERRFKKATSNTVVEYMQRVKIEAAKKQLETSRKTINEVMYDVGYNDNKAFRTVFKRITGLSPADYRNRYNRSAVNA